MLYRLSYRTIGKGLAPLTNNQISILDLLIRGSKNRGKSIIYQFARQILPAYIPYSLRNLMRMILSCSQVKLLSAISCCATCRLLVSQLLK